jgi:two-component system sensor histidine kinase/response regulator
VSTAPTTPASEPPVTCLIVDDTEENLLALSAVLRQPGVDLLTARSGAEALDLLLSHDVGLVLLDVQMPELDGFEVAELMRGSARTRHVPIIFVTAGTGDQHRLFKGYDHGAVDFLFKPVEPHVLRSKAGVFMELHRQRRLLARELRERNDMLRTQEMLTAILGHDLRNPLNAMMLSAQALRVVSTDPQVHQLAARIVESGTRIGRMAADLLDLARVRLGGGIPIDVAPGALGDVVARVVAECRAAYPDQVIDEACSGDLSGRWDMARLEQMLANLVGNAVQHGRSGLPIEVRAEGLPAHVRLTVVNAGRIADALFPSMFDPFMRGPAGTAAGDGLGLGLYIARQIVAGHGGTISARSTEADRTEFEVLLPRDPPDGGAGAISATMP